LHNLSVLALAWNQEKGKNDMTKQWQLRMTSVGMTHVMYARDRSLSLLTLIYGLLVTKRHWSLECLLFCCCRSLCFINERRFFFLSHFCTDINMKIPKVVGGIFGNSGI
jgi:hypothetical protein